MPVAEHSPQPLPARPEPTLIALFTGFFGIAMSAFGGALPLARRQLVERRGWLDDAEFNELLSLCQFLPGPNIGNLSIAVGARFAGWAGSLAAFTGLCAGPFAIVILCGMLYDRYGGIPAVSHAFIGIAAAAAGLVVAMAAKMAMPLLRRTPLHGGVFILLAFLGVGLLRWPLLAALAVLVPASIAVLARRRS